MQHECLVELLLSDLFVATFLSVSRPPRVPLCQDGASTVEPVVRPAACKPNADLMDTQQEKDRKLLAAGHRLVYNRPPLIMWPKPDLFI
jgi:hypothetical protein